MHCIADYQKHVQVRPSHQTFVAEATFVLAAQFDPLILWLRSDARCRSLGLERQTIRHYLFWLFKLVADLIPSDFPRSSFGGATAVEWSIYEFSQQWISYVLDPSLSIDRYVSRTVGYPVKRLMHSVSNGCKCHPHLP